MLPVLFMFDSENKLHVSENNVFFSYNFLQSVILQ